MYNEPGLGSGASYGSVGHAVVERAGADAAIGVHAAGAGATQLYDTYHPGVCDPMPGWKVTWNPPDCSTQVTPDVRGLMPPPGPRPRPSPPPPWPSPPSTRRRWPACSSLCMYT